MKIPCEYITNLSNGTVSCQMLEDCLVAVNKRAKNCRDALRKLPMEDPQSYKRQQEKLNDKLGKYYQLKYDFLQELTPVALHHEVYEASPTLYLRNWFMMTNDVGHRNKAHVGPNGCMEYFYLYYEMEDHSFHEPIDKETFDRLRDTIPVKKISNNINTYGMDEDDLLPMEFVLKIHDALRTKKANYVKV